MPHAADRNLLFGILALQMDMIDRDQLLEAMHAWASNKSHSLGELLVAAQAMDDESRHLLEALMKRRIERHEGNVQESLGSFATLESSLKEQLLLVDDPELSRTVTGIPPTQWCLDRASGKFSGGQRFSIVRFHAQGGLGEVYIAEDRELHRDVALKLIKDDYADEPGNRNRFVTEAELTAGLEHPGIVPVYGLGTSEDGRPYYAMKFIRGESLRKRIDVYHHSVGQGKYTAKEQSLALRKLLGHFVGTCQAVEYAHSRGVLHRDLKPSNVMLGRYGETLVVDWGLAKSVGRDDSHGGSEEATLKPSSHDSSSETVFGRPLGTLPYASPEQISGRLDQVGPASDVYSLGATLFTILTGQPAFKGTHDEIVAQVKSGAFPRPGKLHGHVPQALEAICLKAMAYQPENRYRSPSELTDDINAWLADEPVEVYRDPWGTRMRRWLRRHRGLAAATVAAVTVSLIGLAIGLAVLSQKNQLLAERNADLENAYAEIQSQNRQIQEQKGELAAERDRTQTNYENATRLSIRLAARRGQWTEALGAVNGAIGEGHHDPIGLRLEKVRALYGLIRTDECFDEVESLFELEDKAGHDAEIDLWRGDMLLLRHEAGPALELVQQAIDKGLPEAEEAYATSLLEKDTMEAVIHLNRALELDPFHQRAYHYLVANLIMLGRRDEARDVIAIGSILFPDDANFHLLLAWLLAMEGESVAAVEALQPLRAFISDQEFELSERLFRGVAKFTGQMDHWESGLGLQDWFALGKLVRDFQVITDTGLHSDKSGFPLSLEFRPGGSAITAYQSLLSFFSWKTALTFHIDESVADEISAAAGSHPDGFLYFFCGMIYLSNNQTVKSRDAFARAANLPALIPNVQREALYCLCMMHQTRFLETSDESHLDGAIDALRRRVEKGPLLSSHAGNVMKLCLRMNELGLARTIVDQQLAEKPDDAGWQIQSAEIAHRHGDLLRVVRTVDKVLEDDPENARAAQLRKEAVELLGSELENLQKPTEDLPSMTDADPIE